MPAHRYHPDPDFEDGPDNPDAIYFDFCYECNRQAEQPIYHLERSKLERLWNRMVEVELEYGRYLSDTEAKACNALWATYIFLERHTVINAKSPFKMLSGP